MLSTSLVYSATIMYILCEIMYILCDTKKIKLVSKLVCIFVVVLIIVILW
jgi:hypothetical protein